MEVRSVAYHLTSQGAAVGYDDRWAMASARILQRHERDRSGGGPTRSGTLSVVNLAH